MKTRFDSILARFWPKAGAATVANAQQSDAAKPTPHAVFFRNLAVAVLVIKLIILSFDPHVRLFMGDSATYLSSSVDHWTPPDRSFVYPMIIDLTAGSSHSIITLLAIQTLIGVATTLLAGWILLGFFGVKRGIVATVVLALVIDPSQLFYERMVMTESISTFALIAMLATALAYLRKGNLAWLLVCAGLGVFLTSLRAAMAPLALLLPMTSVMLSIPPRSGAWRRWGIHLLIALAATWAGHTAYKHWYAARAGGEPAYIRDAGMFRLGLVAPLVKPAHFAGTGIDPAMLDEVRIPLAQPHKREEQIWLPGGLIDVLNQHAGVRARSIADTIANRAIVDDPIGVLRLGLLTESEYFDSAKRRERLWSDLGSGQLPNKRTIELLHDRFHYDASTIARTPTIVWSYFSLTAMWPVGCHFALPPLAILLLVFCPRRQRRFAVLLALVCIGLSIGHMLGAHIISFRYLHPFSVLAVVCAGILANALLPWWTRIAALRRKAHNRGSLQPLIST